MGSKTVSAMTGNGSIAVGYHRSTDLWHVDIVQMTHEGIPIPRVDLTCHLDPVEMTVLLNLIGQAAGASVSATDEVLKSARELVETLDVDDTSIYRPSAVYHPTDE